MKINFTVDPPGEQLDDLCDSCTAAIVQAVAMRKRAEKGRHLEPERQQHLPSPAQAEAIAKFNLSRKVSHLAE